MEKDKLEEVVTTIVGCETKQMVNGGYMSKLTCSDNKRYVVFHTKKDKSETKAYQALKTMPMSGIGQVVKIVYKEESYERDGQTYTSRKALAFSLPPVDEKSLKEELININDTGEELVEEKSLKDIFSAIES